LDSESPNIKKGMITRIGQRTTVIMSEMSGFIPEMGDVTLIMEKDRQLAELKEMGA
jgi:hypothetical protein